ncbi:MAG: amidohydrolase family protein [Planctomycetota bacterium]
MSVSPPPASTPSPPPTLPSDGYNRTGLDFGRRLPPPPVASPVIDCHTHLLSAHHAGTWFACADHFGIDVTVTMTPLEEALRVVRGPFAHRVALINVPSWGDVVDDPVRLYDEDLFLRRLDGYHNLGCRVVKFHQAPGSMSRHGLTLGSDRHRRLLDATVASGSIIMSHIGDPQTWYDGKYAEDPATFGDRDTHYDAWERLLDDYRDHPWWGAHLGGWPENLDRLQYLLDRFPNLWLDLSAAKWMVRTLSAQRDAAREFLIRNQDRIIWGSDQVSHADRGFDFYASRWWVHRKLFETAQVGESPIEDPDGIDGGVELRGLALPTEVLIKFYRTNVVRLLGSVGVSFTN